MNSFVAFQAVLAVSCMISLYLSRKCFFPASLFWAFGAVTFGFAAVLGGMKFAGFANIESYHTTAKYFAGSVGLISFALGALSGLFANFVTRFWWWVILVLIVALSVVLILGVWHLPPRAQQMVVGVILLVGLIRLISSGMLAVYLILGAFFMVSAAFADNWIALQTGINAVNIFHIMQSFAVVCFGLSASRDEWE